MDSKRLTLQFEGTFCEQPPIGIDANINKRLNVRKLLQENFNHIATCFQVFFDFIIILISLRVSYYLWEISPLTLQQRIHLPDLYHQLLIGAIFLFTLIYVGAYKKQSSVINIREQRNLIKGIIFATSILIVMSFFIRNVQLGRSQILYLAIVAIILVNIERYLIDKVYTFLMKKGFGARRVLIFGAGTVGKRVAVSLEKYPKFGYLPVGFIEDNTKHPNVKVGNPLTILGTSEDIPKLVQKYYVDEMIFTIPRSSHQCLDRLIQMCNSISLPYKYVPGLHDIAIQKVRTEEIDGIPFFGIKYLQYSAINRIIKRFFDFLFSAIVLVIISPLMALISLTIKLDSTGPVLFKQKRVGKKGKFFTLLKFRTMFNDTPKYAVHPKDRSDPRITRVGRFLRMTSLDELPQFINVLLGDMSVVGPRPEMEFIVNSYNPLHRERLNVKPGITGLWQISLDRTLPIHENIDHDLFYIENQSLLLDMIIIFKTIFVALRGAGAK